MAGGKKKITGGVNKTVSEEGNKTIAKEEDNKVSEEAQQNASEGGNNNLLEVATNYSEERVDEGLAIRRKRALWRFRALVRMVMKNVPWLNEEAHSISKSVQKNVRLLTAKTLTSILKLKTKSLLLKPQERRTPEEVEIIFKAIGQLKALRSYPDSVVMQLAACATYRYYEAGRTILRQGHPPIGLYFVVTGELKVYIKHPLDDNPPPSATIRMGDMFGEIALINELPRGGTVVSSTTVELLMVDGEDFKSVLKESFKGKQGYVLKFLESMSYFNDWDYQTRLNSSLLCRCVKYEKDQTIFGDSDRKERYVYFVISGVCKLIEDMDLEVRYNKAGREVYTPHKAVTPPPLICFSETYSRFFRGSNFKDEDDDKDGGSLKRKKSRSVTKSKTDLSLLNEERISKKSTETNRSSGSSKSGSSSLKQKSLEIASRYSLRKFGNRRSTMKVVQDYWVKTVFMEIATFTEKACFCVGENMKKRRIVAETDVECLLLPHSFIVEGPNSLIWKQIKMFLNKEIPSTKQIFQEFKRQKCWRERILQNIEMHSKMRNMNNIHNVPYSIRVVDDFLFDGN